MVPFCFVNLPQQNAHWSIGQKIFAPPLKLYVLNHRQELRLWKLKNEHLKIFFEYFWVKIGCHSCFDHECNTERGFIDSLYIALGLLQPIQKVHTLANNEIFRLSLWTSLVIACCRIVVEVFADLKSNGGTFNGYIQNTDIPRFPSFRFPLIKIHCRVRYLLSFDLKINSRYWSDINIISYYQFLPQ